MNVSVKAGRKQLPAERVSGRVSTGMLVYFGTDNLGDEIQSLAARRFLPHVDYLIDRDQLSTFRPDERGEQVKVIFNGWFCHYPENFAPDRSLLPLLVSLHVTPHAQARFSAPEVVEFLTEHGPVGTRDYSTLGFLQSIGVDCYFSGCLTMTLTRPNVPRTGHVVLNDVPPAVVDKVARMTDRTLVLTRHSGHQHYSPQQRLQSAASLLDIYAGAHSVITTRLHCAMPCVAMDTPVLLLNTAPDQERFAGLHEFLHHCSLDEFLGGTVDWHAETPRPNPNRHTLLRNNLIRRATRFMQTDAVDVSKLAVAAE